MCEDGKDDDGLEDDEVCEDECEYAFRVACSIRDLKRDVDSPPVGTQISRERRMAEIKVREEWGKKGKGPLTTGDKAILKYYPLPEKPKPKEPKKPVKRKKLLPRLLAINILSQYPGSTGRSAWNLLPEVWGVETVIEHIPIPQDNNREIRRTATATVVFGQRETISFKSFERAWDREKNKTQDQRQREAKAERKRLEDERKEDEEFLRSFPELKRRKIEG